MPRVARHPASLILCRRCKSRIVRVIDDEPPTGNAHSGWPFCTSHAVSFIHCKTRVVRSAPSIWHRTFDVALLPLPLPLSLPERSENRLGQMSQSSRILVKKRDGTGNKRSFGRGSQCI
jgi:hypothetical protein